MTLFLLLLEGVVIYNTEKIKNTNFLLISAFGIYIVNMLILIFTNMYFKWYSSTITLILSRTII